MTGLGQDVASEPTSPTSCDRKSNSKPPTFNSLRERKQNTEPPLRDPKSPARSFFFSLRYHLPFLTSAPQNKGSSTAGPQDVHIFLLPSYLVVPAPHAVPVWSLQPLPGSSVLFPSSLFSFSSSRLCMSFHCPHSGCVSSLSIPHLCSTMSVSSPASTSSSVCARTSVSLISLTNATRAGAWEVVERETGLTSRGWFLTPQSYLYLSLPDLPLALFHRTPPLAVNKCSYDF